MWQLNTFFVPSLSILTTDFAQNGRFLTSEKDILPHLTYRVGDLIKKKNAKHVKCRTYAPYLSPGRSTPENSWWGVRSGVSDQKMYF